MLLRDLLLRMRAQAKLTGMVPSNKRAAAVASPSSESRKGWHGIPLNPPDIIAEFKWRVLLVVSNLANWRNFYNRGSDFATGRWYLAWHNDSAPTASYSENNGASWSNPLTVPFTATETLDVFGAAIARGSALDVYATLNPTQADLNGRYIKRYTFAGTGWQAPVTVYSKAVAGTSAIFEPFAFGKLDPVTRALAWLEQARLNQLAGPGTTTGSDLLTYSWLDVTPSPADQCAGVNQKRWRLDNNGSGVNSVTMVFRNCGFTIPSTATVTGVEVTASCTIAQTDNPRTDLSCVSNPFQTPGVGTIRLQRGPGGQLSSTKSLVNGSAIYGSPIDRWGYTASVLIPANVNDALFGSVMSVRPWQEEGDPLNILALTPAVPGNPPATPADFDTNLLVTNIRVYYKMPDGSIYYVELDANGEFSGSPVLLVSEKPTQHTVQGHFDENGNPVVSWDESGAGKLVRRIGGVWQAEETFSQASISDWDAQAYQLFSASLKLGVSYFHAMKRVSGSLFTHRRSDTGVDVAVELTTLAENPIPAGQNYDGHELGVLMDDGTILGGLATDDGVTFDIWALVGTDG